jgi:hypothetical protein
VVVVAAMVAVGGTGVGLGVMAGCPHPISRMIMMMKTGIFFIRFDISSPLLVRETVASCHERSHSRTLILVAQYK